jgi:hypothetical protein
MKSTFNINDRDLLSSIADYKVLTVKQLSILSQRSGQVVRRRMRALVKEGLIATTMDGYGGGKGRPEDLLFLTEKGARILEGNGILDAVSAACKTGDRFPIDHVLLSNWFRIHLIQIERSISGLSIQYRGDSISFAEQIDGQKRPTEFIPDGVFAITRVCENPKTLLCFLEVDMGTETVASTDRNDKGLRQKVLNYQMLFRTGQYKRYESVFNAKLNGFRLLFLTHSNSRLISLCKLVREMPPSDFIWLVDQERLFSHGLAAKIWARGGRNEQEPQSIVGAELACELPIVAEH